MVYQSPILLVYGGSGTGKTSLIQCGLASRFQSHDWLPLTIRRGSNINASFEKALADAGGYTSSDNEQDWFDSESEDDGFATIKQQLSPLAQKFKAIYLNSFRPVYLIFDQFEEIFVLGTTEEQVRFIEMVREILLLDQPVKMIFSIREEYLGHLSGFEKAVPELFRKKLRVEPMNLPKVRKVIVGATSYRDSNVRLKAGETSLIAEAIFEKIKDKEKTLTIQLPYLQVFLDKFYLELSKDESRQKEAEFSMEALNKIGDIGDVLRNFLEEQAAVIAKKLASKTTDISVATIWKILSPFATLEGTKEPIDKGNLHGTWPDLNDRLVDAVVEAFVDSRILRYTEDTDQYEIAHDSLAKRIAEKRSDEEIAVLEIKRLLKSQTSLKADARELFSEKQLNFVEPFLEKIKLTEEEQALIDQSHDAVAKQKAAEKKHQELETQRLLERQQLMEKTQQSQKRFIRWMSVALVVMIGLVIWAYSQKQKAKLALDNNEKQQAISKARELKAFGDSYMDLGKSNFACASYRAALGSL